MGTQFPLPKKEAEPSRPNFRPMSIVAEQLDGSRWHLACIYVVLGPGHIVLDGDPAPRPKKGAQPPIFGPYVHMYCGQTAGWIKMALGMEVGLGPGHIVLDGDPAPLPRL